MLTLSRQILERAGYRVLAAGRLEDDVPLLQKPFTGSSLSQAVRDALDH